jgi:glutamate N-acetyltransferase/amino-acid N-acetyltransferase
MALVLPSGFRAAGVSAGIKQAQDTLDVSLFISEFPCSAAGVFTTNRVVGAPVIVSRERVPAAGIRGVVINSGNSNACTGERGIADARRMTALVAEKIQCPAEAVLVCSTGVIGRFLPFEKIEAGIHAAAGNLDSSEAAFHDAARGMMTTDTVPKQVTRELMVNGQLVRISGVCKGAAMIAPNMATMLGLVMTDAAVSPQAADSLLRHAVDRSFNCISVDGHMSTSDTVLFLANGASGISLDESHPHWQQFQLAVDAVCRELSQMIIRDAEGASHFVEIRVRGAASPQDAHTLAKFVAESALVKTAITGNDPNWGRIVSAAGYAGIPFREEQVSLKLNGFLLYESGRPLPFEEQPVSDSMKSGDVLIELDFTLGTGEATFWTSDLTAEYVRLNADYTT